MGVAKLRRRRHGSREELRGCTTIVGLFQRVLTGVSVFVFFLDVQ